MVHDQVDIVSEDPLGYSQAVFLGWMGLALIGLAIVFAAVVLGSAASAGFH